MWRNLFNFTGRLWSLLEDAQQNKTEIKELRHELRDLAVQVRAVVYDVRRVAETDAHEREKMLLRLENELLRFERRLPPPKKGEKRASCGPAGTGRSKSSCWAAMRSCLSWCPAPSRWEIDTAVSTNQAVTIQ